MAQAIHLELFSDLTLAMLIATLKRFITRCDKYSKIFIDNAVNFVGANSKLKNILQND